MNDPIVSLSIVILVLSIILAVQSACLPALWWLYLKQAGQNEVMRGRLDELAKDVATLDEVVEKIGTAGGLRLPQ